MIMPPGGQFDVAGHGFQRTMLQMLRPLPGRVGIHDDVERPRLTGPEVQIFPFKKSVDRSARMKSQRMGFHSKENDRVWRRRITANDNGERSILALGFLSRQNPNPMNPPS